MAFDEFLLMDLEPLVKMLCLPYLRRLAIFCRACLGSPLGVDSGNGSGKETSPADATPTPSTSATGESAVECAAAEADSLCVVLNLPCISDLYQSPSSGEDGCGSGGCGSDGRDDCGSTEAGTLTTGQRCLMGKHVFSNMAVIH